MNIHMCSYCSRQFTTKSGLFSHINQTHSDTWKEAWNVKNNIANHSRSKKSNARNYNPITGKLFSEEKYLLFPKICQCGSIISYERRSNKYCSASCGASIANSQRSAKSIESKLKVSTKLKGRISPNKGKLLKQYCHITCGICINCNKPFVFPYKSKRTTCSVECKTHMSVGIRPYSNGRRKIFYATQSDGTEVILDSSWEQKLAIFLNEKNIKWSRPKPIRYQMLDQSVHLYYPDFFLDDYGLYLDPKNNTGMLHSVEKMTIVSSLIPLWYGEVDQIIDHLNISINVCSIAFQKASAIPD